MPRMARITAPSMLYHIICRDNNREEEEFRQKMSLQNEKGADLF